MNDETIEKTIQEVIQRHVDPAETYIFLFGSRAVSGARPASDYDIGLYQEKRIPFRIIARIKNQLEDYPIPVDVDIVDFATVTDDFKKLALKEIKIWNRPKKNLKLI